MPQDFNTALLVLIVGMTTVFVILSLIVLSGKLLINIVNRFSPELSPTISPSSAAPAPPEAAVSPSVLAAILAAVETVTQGKGKVEKIDKEH